MLETSARYIYDELPLFFFLVSLLHGYMKSPVRFPVIIIYTGAQL